ncbi:AraC family transcriptional regulator [Marinomonas posidonica]|uniref:Transcriptional regulator, AraC family n=1 Tax=Marinomonas posidonica (strain CECT 7376 / NCIMB 14433 / IVIA-Po-181) TaxID=491952 RepID=F6CRL6_MARPP|nr:AraC family transcriptional regulator [Marinomonas posidonica]AEF53779.1 transcriptional regulator, AraC family [Marinomonas posidonica IVIA-Po-181]
MSHDRQTLTTPNHYIGRLYRLALEKGLDADSLFKHADLDPSVIEDPCVEIEIEIEKLAGIVEGIWDLLQDEAMGLASSPLPVGAFYMMGRVTVHEATLGKVLQLACRFYNMVSDAYEMTLSEVDNTAVLAFRLADASLDTSHLFSDMTLLAWHSYASWLIQERIPLEAVHFPYAEPQQHDYAKLYPCKRVFKQEALRLVFSQSYLARQNAQSLDALKAYMKRCPIELFLKQPGDISVASDLRALLNRAFATGFPDINESAKSLHMSRRTLIRKLEKEGTSFQKIKDFMRQDRASYWLAQEGISVAVVAEKVGFSDAAVFARAFRRWTGLSPTDYRKLHR